MSSRDGSLRVEIFLECSLGVSLLVIMWEAWSSALRPGAFASISRRYAFDATRAFVLDALLCCSPVAGVAFMEELGFSGIVEADSCNAVRSMTRLWGAGVIRGDSGRDIADRWR